MGNENSAYPKAQDETQYVDNAPKVEKVPIQRKLSTKVEQHGSNKPQVNDETFTNFIQRAKYKIRSMTNIGHHVESRNPTQDVANNVVESKESDQFSHFIQNTRRKLRTVSTMGKNKSFKKGKDSGH